MGEPALLGGASHKAAGRPLEERICDREDGEDCRWEEDLSRREGRACWKWGASGPARPS